jgi:O-antigen ligase
LRATGTSVDPNVLGALLMIAGVLAVAQVVARRPVLPRLWLVALGIPVLAALPLTYSRSAWVGLAAALGFLAVFRERKALALVALGAAALVALPQGRTVLSRLQSAIEGSDRASMMRLDEYRNALEIIERYPVLGIGFGGPPDVDLTPGVSSLYLLIAEQMGLVGLACFLAAVGVALWTSFRAMAFPLGRGPVPRRDRWDLLSPAVVRSTGPPYRMKGRGNVGRPNPHLAEQIAGIAGPVPASGNGSQVSPGSSPEALPGMLSSFQAALLAALIAGTFDQYFGSVRFPHMVALFWLLVALLLVASRLSSQQSAEPNAREAR